MLDSPSLPTRDVRDFWQVAAPRVGAFIFLAFVTLGAVFIVFAKFAALANWLVALVPVALMVAYAILSRFIPAVRVRDDQVGDNLYYMGFIYTLTSLAVALYRFEPDVGFDEIVRNFGIAISSTIAGIALRILFNQMRQDPLEVEYVARQELAEAARRTRQQLDEVVLAFNHFRSATLQSVEEGQAELRQRLAAEVEDVTHGAAKPIEQAAAMIAAALDTMGAQLTQALGRTAAQLEQESGKVAHSASEIQSALGALSAKLAHMQTPDRIIEVQLEPVIATLREAVSEMEKRDQRSFAQLSQAANTLIQLHGGAPKRRRWWWSRS